MFTGIVEELGTVAAISSPSGITALRVACSVVTADARVGDSISVNGCCLTVIELHSSADGPPGFSTEMMGETLQRTSLGGLQVGDALNLEAAMRADGRFGGHVVQGHVDAVAEVVEVEAQEGWTVMRLGLPPSLAAYLVEKGSITVDGTSLTVMAVDERSFSVGLIPHTLSATVLGERRVGDRVNLEADVLAKYVERQLAPYIDQDRSGAGPPGGLSGPHPMTEGSQP